MKAYGCLSVELLTALRHSVGEDFLEAQHRRADGDPELSIAVVTAREEFAGARGLVPQIEQALLQFVPGIAAHSDSRG